MWDFTVSRMCYQMISDELTTTPLGTETAQNHFSTKAERTLLVTNATEYLSVEHVCAVSSVCFVCECAFCVVIGEQIEKKGIVYQITLWLAAEKPSSNNVL